MGGGVARVAVNLGLIVALCVAVVGPAPVPASAFGVAEAGVATLAAVGGVAVSPYFVAAVVLLVGAGFVLSQNPELSANGLQAVGDWWNDSAQWSAEQRKFITGTLKGWVDSHKWLDLSRADVKAFINSLKPYYDPYHAVPSGWAISGSYVWRANPDSSWQITVPAVAGGGSVLWLKMFQPESLHGGAIVELLEADTGALIGEHSVSDFVAESWVPLWVGSAPSQWANAGPHGVIIRNKQGGIYSWSLGATLYEGAASAYWRSMGTGAYDPAQGDVAIVGPVSFGSSDVYIGNGPLNPNLYDANPTVAYVPVDPTILVGVTSGQIAAHTAPIAATPTTPGVQVYEPTTQTSPTWWNPLTWSPVSDAIAGFNGIGSAVVALNNYVMALPSAIADALTDRVRVWFVPQVSAQTRVTAITSMMTGRFPVAVPAVVSACVGGVFDGGSADLGIDIPAGTLTPSGVVRFSLVPGSWVSIFKDLSRYFAYLLLVFYMIATGRRFLFGGGEA